MIAIFPTNKKLKDPGLQPGDPAALQLLERWGRLHWMRTSMGFLAFILQIVQVVASAGS